MTIGKKTRSLHKFSREAAESSWFSKKSEYVICKAGYTKVGGLFFSGSGPVSDFRG
jgi:hypothetical protein